MSTPSPRLEHGHDAITVVVRQIDHVERFGNGANLVDLQKHRVGGTNLDTFLYAGRVSGKQIIAYDLDVHRLCESCRQLVIVLGKRVLHDDKWPLFGAY